MIMTSIVSLLAQLLVAAAPAVMMHPHHPRAIQIGGAGGKITVTYFTVPYNPDQLTGLQPGFEWHLGFSMFNTEVPLEIGDVTVPAGEYKLQSRRGDSAGEWDMLLENPELAKAEMGVFFAQMGGDSDRAKEAVARAEKAVAKLREKLAKTGDDKIYVLGAKTFTAEDAEHLQMTVIHHGFTTTQRMSEDPADGVEFELHVSFGDLHRSVSVHEVFPAAADENKGN